MTRDQIKQKILDILSFELYTAGDYTANAYVMGECQAAEEIMKLWDQGFVYEVPTDTPTMPVRRE